MWLKGPGRVVKGIFQQACFRVVVERRNNFIVGMKMIYLQFNQSKYLLSSANGLKPAFATLSLPSQTFNVTIKLPGGKKRPPGRVKRFVFSSFIKILRVKYKYFKVFFLLFSL